MNRPDDEFDRLQKWQEFQRWCETGNREARPLPPVLKLLAFMVLSIALVIVAALLLAANEWQPGHQAEIAQSYHARRHNPAVEIYTVTLHEVASK